MTKKYTFLFIVCYILISCSLKKKLHQNILETSFNKNIIKIEKNQIKENYIYIKANINLKFNETSNNFKANIRIKKDSVIWISLSLMSLEFSRVLITKDSIFFVDRKDKKYYKGDYIFIRNKLNFSLTFNQIQQIILGNSTGDINEENTKTENYFISEKKSIKNYNITQKINLKNGRLVDLLILDLKRKKSVNFLFSNFKPFSNTNFAKNLNINILSTTNKKIKIEYTKIEKKLKLKIPFKIPSKYEPVYNE